MRYCLPADGPCLINWLSLLPQKTRHAINKVVTNHKADNFGYIYKYTVPLPNEETTGVGKKTKDKLDVKIRRKLFEIIA